MSRLRYLIILCLLICPISSLHAEPDAHSGLFDTAATRLEQGSPLEAAALYRRILEESTDPELRARALLFLSTLYSRDLHLPDTAMACLEQIETTYTDTSVITDARFARGVVPYRIGRFHLAATHFKRFITLYPNHMRSSSARAWLRKAEELAGSDRGDEMTVQAMDKLPDTIRVLIRNKVPQVVLGAPDDAMALIRQEKSLFDGTGTITVTARKGELFINEVAAGTQPLSLRTPGHRPRVDGIGYRGKITLWPKENGIYVVNTLGIEPYLYGVLPKEMSQLWPEEALKAQAIASRSYTYHTLLSRRGTPKFDLEATTAFQVYGGADAETPETTRAVDITRGAYLAFQGRPIIACFHANSGGITESADAVWGAALPYLQGVKDSFSRLTPEVCWTQSVKPDTLVKRLWEKGYKPGGVISISTTDPTPSGRIGRIIVNTTRGRIELTGNEFRLAMGPSVIKSTHFTVTKMGKAYLFEGCGYGHGVGMSQWGARKMASIGFTFDTILHHYYKNVSLLGIDKK